jgi:hypothetical protein
VPRGPICSSQEIRPFSLFKVGITSQYFKHTKPFRLSSSNVTDDPELESPQSLKIFLLTTNLELPVEKKVHAACKSVVLIWHWCVSICKSSRSNGNKFCPRVEVCPEFSWFTSDPSEKWWYNIVIYRMTFIVLWSILWFHHHFCCWANINYHNIFLEWKCYLWEPFHPYITQSLRGATAISSIYLPLWEHVGFVRLS